MRIRIKILLLFAVVFSLKAISLEQESTGNNSQDGSLNTNTVNSTVSSNNTTTDTSTSNTYNGAGSSSEIPVGSAIAPSYMSNGMETCLQGGGSSIQTGAIGYAKGTYKEDEHCNRRRDAKVLSDLGMKVAAVARMCEDSKVWRSLFVSATPCPVIANGRLVVGKRAFLLMKMNPELYIPDYGKVKTVKIGSNKTYKKKFFGHKKNWANKVSTNHNESTTEPRYTETQKYYNALLGIGIENEVNEEDDSYESVSSKFRTSIK